MNVRTLRLKEEFTKVIKGSGARTEDKKVFLIETMFQNGIDIVCVQATRLVESYLDLSLTKDLPFS